MLDLKDGALADHHVGLPRENRLHELRNVGGLVLVVRVGVDDDIRAARETGLDARHERAREAEMRAVDHMVHAEFLRDLRGAVGAAVVHDEPLDLVDAGQRAGRSAMATPSVSSSL